MAGRQKHVKKTYDETSLLRYKGKMYALFRSYMGEKYASQLAEAMGNEYKKTSVDLYTKVRDDQSFRDYLNMEVGSAMQFLAFQLVNEFISSVLLTRNETATMVYYKYSMQGLPSDVILQVMSRATNIIAPEIPTLTSRIGTVTITPSNVMKEINNYVLSTPPAPRSYGGKMSANSKSIVPSSYAGTGNLGEYTTVENAIEDIKRDLSDLA